MKKRAQTSPGASPSPNWEPAWPCLRLTGKGATQRVIIDLSISPNAKQTELVGWHDGALRIRVAAAPIDSEANTALHRWLAKQLNLPASRLVLLRGATSRRKQMAIDADMALIQNWLSNQPQIAPFINIVKPM